MRRFWLVLAAGLWANGAQAADKPTVAPAESWVKPAPLSAIPPKSDVAAKLLLLDEQVQFAPSGEAVFVESRILIQTPQGLAAAGTVALPWKPDTENLIVHKVAILRGGKTIDLLEGHSFTVLRRETNLELAMLDGVLTATLQPEGLQVGDVLDVSYTLVQNDPVMAGHSEAHLANLSTAPMDDLRIRALWTKPKVMRWRASDTLDAPKVARTGATTAVSLDMSGVKPVVLPKDAPPRFLYGRELEFSDFGSWSEVSALFAPLYAKAETLSATSPLKAEIAAIRAASADPKAQAALALDLVQDKVRYVFLGMNDGGLTPADADTTWSRRFGDCKGKTALLIALLRGLGIDAQPAVVSTKMGDGLNERLPTVGIFDHILVRASIGGAVYWLDGTRTGDRDLAKLAVPPFRWALPIQAAGASLVALIPAPLDRAQAATSLTLDASSGLNAPATAKARIVFRGDAAMGLQLQMANLAPADLDRGLKAFWKKMYDFIEPTTVSASFDPSRGEETMVLDGQATLAWSEIVGSAARRYEVTNAALGWTADFKREPGPHSDAPFAVEYPSFVQTTETIKLPLGGAGFSIEGADLDATVAGIHFMRKTSIDKGMFTLETSTRSVAPEFPASEATAAAKTLSDMSAVSVFVRAPASYQATPADIAKGLAAQPTTAAGFVERGDLHLDVADNAKAVGDFDKAIGLDPKSARAYADRGMAHIGLGDYAAAKADLDQAVGLDPRTFDVFHGYGLLAAREGRFSDAAASFTRAIDLEPDDIFALENRALMEVGLGDPDKALADSEQVLRLDPRRSDIHRLRAEIFAIRKAPDREVAELDAALAADPHNPEVRLMRAGMFGTMGRLSDARAEAGLAIAAKPTAQAYLYRAFYRDKADVAGKNADIEAALKLEPHSAAALRARAGADADAKNYAAAIAELTRDATADPGDSASFLVERGKDFALSGDAAHATKDFADVRTRAAANADALNELCWDQATIGFALETALNDCVAALKAAPLSAAITDSHAFVLMRLGRLDEALAGYDAALKLDPYQTDSLYGRGLVKLKKGLRAEGLADIAAAHALDAGIDETFAGYGLRP